MLVSARPDRSLSAVNPETNGGSTVRILIKGGADLSDCLLAESKGGTKLARGLEELLLERLGAEGMGVEVVHEPRPHISQYLLELDGIGSDNEPADVVVMSLFPDVVGSSDLGQFLPMMTRAIQRLRERGSEVVFLNASTVDPADQVSKYSEIDEPFSLRAQRLDLDLLRISAAEGLPIIDADRILAEYGATDLVNGPLDYDARACEAICLETLRVIEDGGLLEKFEKATGDGATWLGVGLPFLTAGVETVSLLRWYGSAGDVIHYGEPLCDVRVKSATSLVRTKEATNLASSARLEKSAKRTIAITARFQITAAETVQLQKTQVQEAETINVGDQLGLAIRWKGSGQPPADARAVDSPANDDLPRMRVVARILEPEKATGGEA